METLSHRAHELLSVTLKRIRRFNRYCEFSYL